MSLSRVARAKSEIRRKDSFTWSEAAIDIRCRIFLSELEWPWTDLELSKSWTPVEEIHAMSEYPLSGDMLCEICKQFDVSVGTHQPNGTSLFRAASEGCQLCSMILDTFIVSSSEQNLEILRRHDNPLVLELKLYNQRAVTAGYTDQIMHNGASRLFSAPRSLAVLPESNTILLLWG